MWEFPFDNLRIVEVFPVEGITGLAAKSLVMLSQEQGLPFANVERADASQKDQALRAFEKIARNIVQKAK